MVRRFAQNCLFMLVPFLLTAAIVRADQTLSFADGSTVSGSFVYDATTNTITSFSFTSTAFGGTSFVNSGSCTSTSTACSIVLSNQNGDEVLAFDGVQPYQATGELDIVLSCGGVANCLSAASVGNSFAVTAGVPNCVVGAPGFCIASGQQYSVPECLGNCEDLLAGNNFLTITDPPSTDTLYTLTLSTTSTGTVYAGNNSGGNNNNGGGGNTNVPEPSTLVLSALGFAAFALKRALS